MWNILEGAQVGHAEFLLHVIIWFTTHLASILHTLSGARSNDVSDQSFWFSGGEKRNKFLSTLGDTALPRKFCSASTVVALALWGGYSQEAGVSGPIGKVSMEKPTALWTPHKVGIWYRAEDRNFHKVPHTVRLCLLANRSFLVDVLCHYMFQWDGPKPRWHRHVISNILIYLKDKLYVQVLFYRSIPWSISQLEPTFFSAPHFRAGWLKANEFALNDMRTPFVDSLPQNRVE